MHYTTPIKAVTTMTVSHGETAEQRAERYREALQQAEMDMGVIWMALPPKERETLRIARDRILKALEVGSGGVL